MKKLIVAGAILVGLTAPALAEYGRVIGDGTILPREIVEGKNPRQRAVEIWNWMADRGGIAKRSCTPRETGGCTNLMSLKLAEGVLTMSRFADEDITYCRFNGFIDTSICYSFRYSNYFSKVRDSKTGEWVHVWDSRDENKEVPAAPSVVPGKPPELEL